MKKKLILVITAIFVSAALIVILFPNKTINDYIVDDYSKVLKQYPKAIYYETECTLSGYYDELGTKTGIVSYKNIFQVTRDTIVYYSRDLINDDLTIEKRCEHWQGSFSSDPRETKILFREALEILEKSSTIKPHSDKMTIRWPLGSKYDHALYIFGSTLSESYIGVDVITGEVQLMQ